MKRKYDIGFFSSADRGLDTLLELIPQVEEQLGRKVSCVWAYGWDMFDKYHSKNPEKMKWKWQVIRKMADVGMENKGRLSHEELAKLMQDTKVWAYPTEFTEIHCITALKAQEAGCIPVTTNVGALAETVVSGHKTDGSKMSTDKDSKDTFAWLVCKALEGDKGESGKVPNRYWSDVAKEWDKALA